MDLITIKSGKSCFTVKVYDGVYENYRDNIVTNHPVGNKLYAMEQREIEIQRVIATAPKDKLLEKLLEILGRPL